MKSSPVATPPQQVVTVEPVAKGIWRLAGSGNHRSIVFEFADHLVLFEAPFNETRSKAVIDEARKLSSKPLTHAVVSHHHFDHSGGLRVAVAEGLTIITHKDNEAFFKDLVARPWTVQPDALAKAPKPLNLQLVDDTLTLKDAAMELQLYHLLDNAREGTNLFGYVPNGPAAGAGRPLRQHVGSPPVGPERARQHRAAQAEGGPRHPRAWRDRAVCGHGAEHQGQAGQRLSGRRNRARRRSVVFTMGGAMADGCARRRVGVVARVGGRSH